MFDQIIDFIRSIYPGREVVQLHSPVFLGNEKKYLIDCIDTTFVSYVGKYVNRFEAMTTEYTGSKYAVAVVNGTAALHIALLVAGVGRGDEVITQPLTFVATANAVSHNGSIPVFVDVDLETMGMSPVKLKEFLSLNCDLVNGDCINKTSGRKIKAIIPVHTFGHPCKIDEIVKIADAYNLFVIEDAAESLGSFYKNKHTGTFGLAGIISYNGNKTVTTGGGGMIITDNKDFARKAKHITTTGKIPHPWEYVHDVIAYNYRMTNVNAAIGVAQMENIMKLISNKRETSELYKNFFFNIGIPFFTEPVNSRSNYWLNCIIWEDKNKRDAFLKYSNENKVMTRPIWRLMNKLDIYALCQSGNLENSEWFGERVINIPSGFRE